MSWPKEPEATKPFGNPFDRLTVLSQTLSVIEGSKVEGLEAPSLSRASRSRGRIEGGNRGARPSARCSAL